MKFWGWEGEVKEYNNDHNNKAEVPTIWGRRKGPGLESQLLRLGYINFLPSLRYIKGTKSEERKSEGKDKTKG